MPIEPLNQTIAFLISEAAHRAKIPKEETEVSNQADKIVQMLDSHKDLRARIEDILKNKPEKFSEQWQQLHDIVLYLHVVDTKQNDQDFHGLVRKIHGYVTNSRDVAIPPWQSLTDKIDQELGKKVTPGDFFKTYKDSPIEKEIFAHINAEKFISKSGLEGHFPSVMVKYLVNTLPLLSSFAGKDHLMTLLSSSLPSLENFKKVIDINSFYSNADQFEDFFAQRIKALKPGESFLVHSGWKSYEMRHTMYMEIGAQENGKLTARLYNKGSGAENHPAIRIEESVKIMPYIERADIDRSVLISSGFARALMEINTMAQDQSGQVTEYKARDIYQGLFANMGGKVQEPAGNLQDFVFPQAGGVCTWAALMAVASTHIPAAEFARMEYEIHLKTLCDYYKTNENSLDSDEIGRMLLRKSAEQFAVDTLSYYRQALISGEELAKVNAILKTVFSTLDRLDQKQRHNAGEILQFDVRSLQKIPPKSGKMVYIPPNSFSNDTSTKHPTVISLSSYQDFSWTTNPQTIAAEMQRFRQFCYKNIEKFDGATAEILFNNFFSGLPLPTFSNDFWEGLTKHDREMCLREMTSITDLMQLKSDGANDYIRKKFIANAYKGLAIAHRIAWLDETLKPLMLNSELPHRIFLTKIFGSEKDGRPPLDANLQDAEIRADLFAVRDYFNPTPTSSIFLKSPLFIYSPHEYANFLRIIDYQMPDELSDAKVEEIRYIMGLLGQESIQNKLFTLYPDLRYAGIRQWMAHSLTDLEGKILPQIFCDLKKQTALSLALLLRCSPHAIRNNNTQKLEISINSHVDHMGSPTATLNMIEDRAWSSPNWNTFGDVQSPSLTALIKLSRYWKQEWDNSDYNISPSTTHSSYDESTVMALKSLPIPNKYAVDLSLQDSKELLNVMNGSDYDGRKTHLEMQAVKAIAYFAAHREKLEDPDYQALLTLIFFEQDNIEKVLKLDPKFSDTLVDFINSSLEVFKSNGNVAAAAFMLEFGRACEKIVEQTLGEVKGKSYPDPIANLHEMLSYSNLSNDEKVFLSKHVAASFTMHASDSLTESQLVDLFKAMALVKTVKEIKLRSSNHLEFEVSRAFAHFSAVIQHTLQSDRGSQVLNAVAASIKNSPIDSGAWDCISQYPMCLSENGEMTFNAATGNFYFSNKEFSTLPSIIKENPDFKRMFTQSDYKTRYHEGVYEFLDEDGKPVRLRVDAASSEVIIQKQWEDNQWSQYVPLRYLSGRITNSGATPLGSLDLYHNKTHWLTFQNEKPRELLIADLNRRLACRAPVEHSADDPDSLLIKSFEKQGANGEVLKLLNSDPVDFPWQYLKPFAGRGFLQVWGDSQGPKQLVLPKQDLSFTIVRKGSALEAHCEQLPEYKLSSNQNIKGIDGDFKEALVLENAQGKRIVLIPRLKIIPLQEGALNTKITLNHLMHAQKESYLSFDLDSTKGLTSSHREQKLFLANLCLGRKKYSQACNLIRSTVSSVLPYNRNESEMLSWISELNERTSDPDYKAHSVELLAYALYVKSLHYAPPKNSETGVLLRRIFTDYNSSKHEADAIHLSIEEESLIFKSLYGREEAKASALDPSLPVMKNTVSLLPPTSGTTKNLLSAVFDKELFNSIRVIYRASGNKAPSQGLLTRPGSTMLTRFFPELYTRAKACDPRLQLELAFAALDWNIPPAPLVALLETVMRNPDAFPDAKTVGSLIKAGEWYVFQDLVLKPYQTLYQKPLKEAGAKTKDIAASKRSSELETVGSAQIPSLSFAVAPLPQILKEEQRNRFFSTSSQEGIRLDAQEIRELKQSFSTIDGTLSQDIDSYWHTRESTAPYLEPEEIGHLHTLLLIQEVEEAKQIALLRHNLLAAANELPSSSLRATAQELEVMGGARKRITMDDLIVFCIDQDAAKLQASNHALSKEHIEAIARQTAAFLERSRRLQKIKRGLTTIAEIEMDKQGAGTLRYLDLSAKLYEELCRPGAFLMAKEPAFAVFEYLADIQLHSGQVSDLNKMIYTDQVSNPNMILQKIMGSGKSKVYLPILALKKADGDHLAVIVVPESQYETSLSNMEASSGQIFHQIIDTITFNRDSGNSLEHLREFRKKVETIRLKKQCLVITDKSLKCLATSYKEMWAEYLKAPQEDLGRVQAIKELGQILALLRTKGKAVFDESDILLNNRNEVNYTLGREVPFDSGHCLVVSELYTCLQGDPELNRLLSGSFNQEIYHTKIKPNLIEEVLNFKREPSSALGGFLLTLNKKNRELVISYLSNADDQGYVDGLKDPIIRNHLSILKEEFNHILPLTLSKRCGEHYGFSDNSTEYLAVPYLANNQPSKVSRFGNQYELINYTTQTFLKKDIPLNLIRNMVEDLKQKAIQEISHKRALPVHKTRAYADFLELCGGDASYNLMRCGGSEMAKIAVSVKSSHNALFKFLRSFVYPHIVSHEEKLSANALTLTDMFSEVQGFTGTPWNQITYHNKLDTYPEKGTDGKTLGILWKNSRDAVDVLASDRFPEVLDQLHLERYHAFIDTGSLFNGVDDETVAKAMLKKLPASMKGIVFYKDNRQVILERNRLIPIPLEHSQLSPAERFTYYDQWHTTGADIKQYPSAKALVTIGKHMMLRDLLQGVWRMRELDRGHSVDFKIIPEAAASIRQNNHLNDQDSIGLAEVFGFAEANQQKEILSQLLLSIPQKIEHLLQDRIMAVLMRHSAEPAQVKKTSNEIYKAFVMGQKDLPYKNFGRREMLVDADIAVCETIDEHLDRAMSIIEANPLLGDIDKMMLKKEMEQQVKWELLPKMMLSPQQRTTDTTVEIEVQKEQEVHVQALKEIQQENFMHTQRTSWLPHWNWENNNRLFSLNSDIFQATPVDEVLRLANEDLPILFDRHGVKISISEDIPPVMEIRDIFAHESTLAEYQDIFDLESSYNFLPIKTRIPHEKASQVGINQKAIPFDDVQYAVNFFLMVPEKDRVRMVLLSQAEAGFFLEKIGSEKSEYTSRNIILGQMELGVLKAENPVQAEALLASPEAKRLLVQAKFYDGQLIYSPEELKLLEIWISQKGAERMQKLFCDIILRSKPHRRKEFEKSALAELFTNRIQFSIDLQ
jgi:hypothetical protein